MRASATVNGPLVVGSAVALAATVLHDVAEFGTPVPENSLVVAVALTAGILAWSRLPRWRRVTRAVLLTFALVMLVGGAIASVLPLPIWPFEPDQGVGHYVVHGVWAIGVGYLVWVLLFRVRDA
jgi:hypothetical protein